MKIKKMTRIAMIAAIYAAVTVALAPISFGTIQVRVAEALTLLPIIYPPAIWGVTLGCALANFLGALSGANPLGYLDILIGTFATFLAAVCTYKLRDIQWKKIPVLAALMPVIFNAIIIGAELAFVFTPTTFWSGYIILAAEVGIGELIACFVLGLPLIHVLSKNKILQK